MSAFDRLANKLAGRPGVSNPRGLAYAIGKRRYGSSVMSQAAQRGVSAKTVVKQQRGRS